MRICAIRRDYLGFLPKSKSQKASRLKSGIRPGFTTVVFTPMRFLRFPILSFYISCLLKLSDVGLMIATYS